MKDYAKLLAHIRRAQRLQQIGQALLAIGFPMLFGLHSWGRPSVMHSTALAAATIIACIGAFLWVYSWGHYIQKTVRCPGCGKSLAYLLTGTSHSRSMVALRIPGDLPPDINECPYCGIGLREGGSTEKEIPPDKPET